jgi:[acyl-carrier-protein] S-malonyltransferase
MAAAADAEPSAMAAVIGADYATVDQACAARRREGGRLWVANLNAPGQVVVAGGAEDVDWLSAAARRLGLRRVVPLAVAGAFHSPFMAPASPRLARALASVAWSEPRFPVYSNVTARPHQPGAVAQALVDQVVSPVRFTETLQAMAAAGVDMFAHVGPGDVTAGLARRTLGDVGVLTVSSTADVDAAVGAVSSIR